MTKQELEKNVKKAFTSHAPNVLDNILSECSNQEGRVIVMTEIKSKKNYLKMAASVAAMFVLLLIGVYGAHIYQINNSIDSIVSLDVNPSVEIKVNQKEKVLAVNALNEDGKIVIGDITFKGNNVEEAVNALIESMLRNDYLNDDSNSILISVYGNNSEKANALQEKLSKEITAMLQTDSFSAAVLSQVILPDFELQKLADSYGITLGKARLIQQYISQEPQYSFEDLVGLTINELNLMSKTNGVSLEDVQLIGNISNKTFIGTHKAKEIALSDAKAVSESEVSKLEIEMDYEHNVMIYEVSFIYADYKYNYDINAMTGEITEAKSNPIENKGNAENNNGNASLDKEKSIKDNNIADSDNEEAADDKNSSSFNEEGVKIEEGINNDNKANDKENKEVKNNAANTKENDAENKTNSSLEKDNNKNIDSTDNKNSQADIDSQSAPVDNQQSAENSKNQSSSEKNSDKNTDNENKKDKKAYKTSTDYIGEETAKDTALLRANLDISEIADITCELYIQKDAPIYKIKFIAKGYEYSCDVNAVTGEIMKFDKQPNR